MFSKRLGYELRALVDIPFLFCAFLLIMITSFSAHDSMESSASLLERYVALAAIVLFGDIFFSRQRHNVVEIEAQFRYSIRGKLYRSTFIMMLLFFVIMICTYSIGMIKTQDYSLSLLLYLLNMYSVIAFFGSVTLFAYSLTKNLGITLILSIIVWYLNSAINSFIPEEFKIFNSISDEYWLRIKIAYLVIGMVLFIISQWIYNKRFQYVLSK
ncbi:hypothetical protein DCC85_05960 [Paenibacillus sp. CAA11]|uniref:hypothetical protein n=1 Tax=Paenibacillus sp. CAA11 TaxID=1532905 RepID=UPI000D35B75D|nr:hypothetical protein [Paenibacillus sp. CAA11]AWB43813.1 hypothetical protein DCC85_05960 [Paenibacillus sp. CAA11]